MLARFSTVAGETGSPDTWRDVRGFSLKFYTSEGNYDLVGNNTPVFFVRDPMKFPHFIRSQKRLPDSGLRDNHMQWDFWTSNPESAHQVTYLMGERGLPRTWRHMNGYGSHTYMWVNAAGEKFWVKYHFHTQPGHGVLQQRRGRRDGRAATPTSIAATCSRRSPAASTRAGRCRCRSCPMPRRRTYRFNPFDLTKTWSHKDYPLIPVGTMTLNRNPENFFAQIEQAAFSPGNTVPGHRPVARQDAARPRLRLQRRAAQSHRHELPPAAGEPAQGAGQHLHVRRPDGLPAQRQRAGLRAQQRRPPVGRRDRAGAETAGRPTARWCAAPTRCMPRTTTSASRARWCARCSTTRSARKLVEQVAGSLLGGVRSPVLERAFDYWKSIDADVGRRIEEKVRAGSAHASRPKAWARA